MELPETISGNKGRGFITAPAGHGKTYLIAETANFSASRQLLLTHTYAGVAALRKKLREQRVDSRLYRVDTIASWSLRLCVSYPGHSGWKNSHPANAEWNELYEACALLLQESFLQKILRASYSNVLVDEYQDCSTEQHNLVLALAKTLPVCVLGDPLQGIFSFGGGSQIDWESDIKPNFEVLGRLETPWRWKISEAESLGSWLKLVRQKLECGESIDLLSAPSDSVNIRICESEEKLRNTQINTCKYFALSPGHDVAAIHKGDNQHKAKCHALAKNTGGRFSSIEEVEGKRLSTFVKHYDQSKTTEEKLKLAVDFVKSKCLSGVARALPAATLRGETSVLRKNTKNPDIAKAANKFLEHPKATSLRTFLVELKQAPETDIHARDLFNRLLHVLSNCGDIQNPVLSVGEEIFQSEFRHAGRPTTYPRIIGTTLLLKGLEFDHAIVLDATTLRKRDLYVALTRGSRSLTIISRDRVLNPPD